MQLQRERERREREYIFPNANYILVKLPAGLNDCDHIKKMLNKNHIGKVVRQQSAEELEYLKIGHISRKFVVSFALSIVKV